MRVVLQKRIILLILGWTPGLHFDPEEQHVMQLWGLYFICLVVGLN